MTEEEMPYTDITYEVTSPKRELARLRDQLIVQIHLAKAEVRTHWEELEHKWVLLQSRLSGVKIAGRESQKEISEAVRDLIQELSEGYRRIRDALKEV